VLKRFLAASALLAAVLGLSAVTPRAALSATSRAATLARPTNVTQNVVDALLPGKAQRHHPNEPTFIIKNGRVVVLPAASNGLSYWSGYAVDACPTCHIRYINANFKEPTVSCAHSTMGTYGAAVAFWVGLDGDGYNTVEQIGVQGNCTSTSAAATYTLWYEMAPAPMIPERSYTIHPGDSISISVYYNQANKVYDFTFSDSTEAESFTKNGVKCAVTCLNNTAEVIAEDPSGGVGSVDLAQFNNVTFSGTTVTSLDGTKGDLCSGPTSSNKLWTSDLKIMYDPNGAIMAYPGALTTCSGPDGFTDFFAQSA
jgi:hypothetical protein